MRLLVIMANERIIYVRRQFFFSAFVVFLLCGSLNKLNAQEKLNFVYISPNAGSSSVLWVAKDMGFFKKHGLDVNVIYIEGTPKALMALFAGELQVVAGTGPAVASARVRGADATMIMGLEAFLPYYLVATSSVKGVEDLKGKVGANHSAATSADFAMRLGLRNIGLDPERDVNLRVVGATNLRMLAMQQGQAQFTVITTTELEQADKMGFKVLVDLASKRIPYPHSGVITSQKILREKHEAILRFGRATVEAIHFFKTQKTPTIGVLKKYAKTDLSTLDTAYAYLKGALPDLPYPTLEGMKTILAEMARSRPELLKTDVSPMVDASIVKTIDDEGFLKRLK
jgi:ABC-type nitrate/sulfonate/bicarbonate transport system substrate-binding protein